MRLLVDNEITAALQNPAANLGALAYVLDGDPPSRDSESNFNAAVIALIS